MRHAPEPGLHTIRHYGLYANQNRTKRKRCRELLAQPQEETGNTERLLI